MQFDPKAAEGTLLKDGDTCDFEVVHAEDKTSKSGNEMIKLTIKAWDSEGTQGTLFYYMIFAWHIKQFCEATGQLDKFQSGKFEAEDAKGKCGKFINRIEKDLSGQYADKNSVKKFLKASADIADKKDQISDDKFDDDIPF